jgi:hypothetical protein
MAFRRNRVSNLIIALLFTAGLLGVTGISNASAITIPKTITTCTNVNTGVNRLLIKGVCKSSIEKKVFWKYTGIKLAKGRITTCINLKTSIQRLLLKGGCKTESEKLAIWIKSTATPPNPSSFTYKVGAMGPGDGVIFFVDTKNQFPSFDYLEAAPDDLAATSTWCSNTSHEIAGLPDPVAYQVGRGLINSSKIFAACTSGAANAAHAYSKNGKSDWFLPSRDELMMMYSNIYNFHTFVNADYWSSSQDTGTRAITVHFGNGDWYSLSKSLPGRVRPIRAFSVASFPTPAATAH